MRKRPAKRLRLLYGVAVIIGGLFLLFFILPSVTVWKQTDAQSKSPFPVSVDPEKKIIRENPFADALFFVPTQTQATAIYSGNFFVAIARAISGTPIYQLAATQGAVPNIVTINPGLRKEQVAALFGKKLGWSASEQKQFVHLPPVSNSLLQDGIIAPGDYAVSKGDSILAVQAQIGERFRDEVLARYTSAVQKIVPLDEGLTIASIIERETSDPKEMRVVSGIIWNRLFKGMKLQMDSTVQYSKATGQGPWWPPLSPHDKYIDSPYNTYQNEGLPPDPISEPSVAAVLAALNPVKTSCLYYFHDDNSVIHCSDTYEQHVALLKKYYGQGR